jgi:hypothetical protein
VEKRKIAIMIVSENFYDDTELSEKSSAGYNRVKFKEPETELEPELAPALAPDHRKLHFI